MKYALYFRINKWETEGYKLEACSAQDWAMYWSDMPEYKFVQYIELTPDTEWLAREGLAMIEREIQETKDDAMKQVSRLKEMEAKYLQLEQL